MSRQRRGLSLLGLVLYAGYFFEVRKHIFAGRYEQAMFVVDRMYKLYKEKKPSKNVRIQLNLIFGMISWNLSQYEQVYLAARIALDQIARALRNEKNERDINKLKYFRAYCKVLVGYADLRGGVRGQYQFDDIDALHDPEYDLNDIDEFLQRTFPVGDTGWW